MEVFLDVVLCQLFEKSTWHNIAVYLILHQQCCEDLDLVVMTFICVVSQWNDL